MRELLDTIRAEPERYRQAIADKGVSLDLDRILKLDGERRKLLRRVEEARRKRNEVSRNVGKDEKTAAREQSIEAMRVLKLSLKRDVEELAKAEEELDALLLLMPNPPASDAPRGANASANVVVKRRGNKPSFSFEPLDHLALGEKLDCIDTVRGAAVSGFRGYYLKNEAVLLHEGVLWLALEKLRTAGFTLMAPPTIVKESALIGSGHFPAGKEEVYRIVSARHYGEEQSEPDFLVGTSEPSLLAYYAKTTFDENELPKLLCGISPCYRSEIGSYGRDTKGIYRIHEFMKVEQVVICRNDLKESEAWFAKLLAVSETILDDLELPYQVVDTATGEMGVGKYRMYDIETWMPSRNSYSETHSNSMLLDWQAHRLNIRYRDREGKLRYVHTLNNTAIASPRILIPLLEVHQQRDGSVRIPKALQSFVGTDVIKPKP